MLPYQETLHIGDTIAITVIRATAEHKTGLLVSDPEAGFTELDDEQKSRVIKMLTDSEEI